MRRGKFVGYLGAVSRSQGGRRRTAGERGGDQTATAREGMLGGVCEPQARCSERSGLASPLSATTVQRDDQTLAGSPGEERRPEQQRRQQIQGAFDQNVRHGHDGGSYRPRDPVQATQPQDLTLGSGRFARMTPAPEQPRLSRGLRAG
jgi:hypothetical protein